MSMMWKIVATTSVTNTATQVRTHGKENSLRHRRLIQGVKVATEIKDEGTGVG